MKNIRVEGVKGETPYYDLYAPERIKNVADEAFNLRGDHTLLDQFNSQVDMAVISEKERITLLKSEIQREQKRAQDLATQKYKEMFPASNINTVRALLQNEPEALARLGLDENNLSNDNIMKMNQSSIDKQYQYSQRNFVAEVVNKGVYQPVTNYNR